MGKRIFFFQAEDGIRDFHVTGVQTCALPICESRDRHQPDDQDCSDAAPGPAVRTLGARRNVDASSLRVRLGLHTTPLRAGIRRKGESTLIVYQTKLEPCKTTVGLRGRLRETRRSHSSFPSLESPPRGRECVSKVSITARRLGERRRGDRAANVTDCRSVSRGVDYLPRHPRLRSPAVHSESASDDFDPYELKCTLRLHWPFTDPRTFL